MADRPTAPTAAWLSGQLRRAELHAENVEPLLAAAVQAALDELAELAAKGFAAHARPYGLTAAAPAPQSTMIALYPTAEQAAALALDQGEPVETLHVTLAYLGETTGSLAAVGDALRPVAQRHAALAGTVGGVGSFDDYGDGHPIIALPDVPGLVELRVAATAALVAAGIAYARNHGFCAHLTLAYRPAPEVAAVQAGIGQSLSFGSLWVVRGDTERVELPLAGAPPITASGGDRSRVPIPGTDWVGDMRGVDALVELLAAEKELDAAIAAVAAQHAPEGGYGDTYWNAETAKVFWVCGDWTSTEEADAAEADFRAIDGVDDFEACWECAPPGTWYDPETRETHYGPGDGWEQVYAAETLEAVPGDPLRTSLEAAAGDPPPWSMPMVDEIVDADEIVARITARTKPVRDAAVQAAALPVVEGIGLSFDVTNPLVARVMAQAGSQIVDIAETTQLNVMRIVRKSYEAGLSIPHTAAAIREGMQEADGARSRLIARTELAGAVNGGSLAAVKIVEQATGTSYRKIWMTAPGAKHPRHYLYDGLNGQARKLTEKFDVGGAELDHPGDSEGPPREICNCRCAMKYGEADPGE